MIFFERKHHLRRDLRGGQSPHKIILGYLNKKYFKLEMQKLLELVPLKFDPLTPMLINYNLSTYLSNLIYHCK